MIEGVGHICQRHIGPLAGQPVGQHPSIDLTRSAVLPDTTNVVTAVSLFTSDGATSGPCSSTTCALVPPNPNEDTPARRGRCIEAQSVGSATTFSRRFSNGMCGLGFSECRLAGCGPRCTASTVLQNPAIPAAASK